MTTRRLVYAACTLAFLGLALGFALRQFYLGSAVIVALGFIWLLAIRRRWGWISPTFFLIFGVFNAILILILAPPYLEIISLSATLITWDLDHFITRLERIRSAEMARSVENAHLLRLFASVGVGILFAAAAMLIHIQLSFAMAFLAGLFALIAMNMAISRLAPPQIKPPRPPRAY